MVNLRVTPKFLRMDNGVNQTIHISGNYSSITYCQLKQNFTTWKLYDNYGNVSMSGMLPLVGNNSTGNFSAALNVTAVADNTTEFGRVYNFSTTFEN